MYDEQVARLHVPGQEASRGVFAQRLRVRVGHAIRRLDHLAGVRREQPVANILHVRTGEALERVGLGDRGERHPERGHHLAADGPAHAVGVPDGPLGRARSLGKHFIEEKMRLLGLHHPTGGLGHRPVEGEFAKFLNRARHVPPGIGRQQPEVFFVGRDARRDRQQHVDPVLVAHAAQQHASVALVSIDVILRDGVLRTAIERHGGTCKVDLGSHSTTADPGSTIESA